MSPLLTDLWRGFGKGEHATDSKIIGGPAALSDGSAGVTDHSALTGVLEDQHHPKVHSHPWNSIEVGDIGSETNRQRTIWATELHVGTLVSDETQVVSNGRITLASGSTRLARDLSPVDTEILVEHNSLASGDRIYMESNGKVEWMSIDSAASGPGPYLYTVTRDLDGSGANQWHLGDTVLNTGATGDHMIEIFSGSGALGATGPTIIAYMRDSGTYNDLTECFAAGHLKDVYDYSSEAHGAAFGKYIAGETWVAADDVNGFRIINGLATLRFQVTPAGVMTIRDSGGAAVFTFDASAGAEFTKPLTIGTSGGIYQGTGTFASPTTGLKLYNSGGIGLLEGYLSGVVQAGFNSSGKIVFGGAAGTLDADGITLEATTTYSAARSLNWEKSDGTLIGYVNAQDLAGSNQLDIRVVSVAGDDSSIGIIALAPTGETSGISLQTQVNSAAKGGITLGSNDPEVMLSAITSIVFNSIALTQWAKITATGIFPGNQTTHHITGDSSKITVSGPLIAGGGSFNTSVLGLEVDSGAEGSVTAEKFQMLVDGATLTITGSFTNERYSYFAPPTITAGSALTVTNAATLYIEGAPVAGGSAAITNPYSLWIDAGLPRIDSASANGSVATVMSNVGPVGSNTAIQEWLTININGTTRYIPCW